ncbi:MAG TPA: transporter [Roseateles sp.]|nr:transporter [Roseateles sp.]
MSLTTTAASYGADAHGLICGYRFLPERPAEPIASAAAALPLLAQAGPGFVWLHLNLSHAGAEAWLRAHAGLSDNFFEALHEGSRSTRIERDGEGLFAVVNDVTFDFGFDASDVATLWLSVGEHLVLSARRQPLRAIDRLRMAVKRGETLGSSVALLEHLLADQADELQRIVRQATGRVDDIEDALLAGKHEGHAAEVARLRRLMVRLQRLLAPEPSALMRTLAKPPRWVSPEDRQQLHRASEEFALVLGDIAGLQERIKLMQDESAARVAEENNRSLFTLTMVTVLALPINLVSGLFGMNVGGIPLAENPTGFWIMVSLIAGLTGLIAFLALRRMRR